MRDRPDQLDILAYLIYLTSPITFNMQSKISFMKAHNFIDLTDISFGNLLVVGLSDSTDFGVPLWKCICLACESDTIILRTRKQLDRKNKQHCGCLYIKSDIPFYYEKEIWKHMIQRCHNEKDPSYSNYGGRGIFVDEFWRNSFEIFLEDMGPKPIDDGWDYSIERKNNELGYFKENCKWERRVVQNRNTRRNVISSIEQANEIRNKSATGKYTYQELADLYGCSRSTIKDIIYKRTWYEIN
jgi:hypothetical protein